MKKLSTLIVAFLLTAGMAYAQSNEAYVDQLGDNQDVSVTQTGFTNFADVDQFTDNSGAQAATVLQTGTSNMAIVSQSQTGGGNNGGNSAYIEQIGTGNSSTQISIAPASQSGQILSGYQDGNSNVLNQTISRGYTNSLEAEQYGTGNIATQTNSGNHSHGEVYQNGSSNVAEQSLSGTNNGYSSGSVSIEQFGTENYASQMIEGFGSSHWNNTEIYQEGMNNDAWQAGSGRWLNAELSQVGNDNWSMQSMSGERHSSTVTQTGNMNHSTVTQNN